MNLDEIKPQSCWTNEGFNQVFEEHIKQDITYVKAYELTEEMHIQLFGRIRYASYESFRRSRHSMLFGNSK